MEALVNALDKTAVALSILDDLKHMASTFDRLDGKTPKTMMTLYITDKYINVVAFEATDELTEHFQMTYDRERAKFRID